MRWLKRKIYKIKRVITFLPIIWKGYDFDYKYAIELSQYQLTRMADFLESDKAKCEGALRRAKRIRTTVRLMKNVFECKYALEYHDALKSIYGQNVFDFKFTPIENDTENDDVSMEYESWPNAAAIDAASEKLRKQAEVKQQKAERILWKMIHHNIRDWWD